MFRSRRATRGALEGARAPPSLSRTGHTIRPDSMSFYFVNMGGGGRGDIALQDVRNVGMFVLQYWTNNNTVAFDLTKECMEGPAVLFVNGFVYNTDLGKRVLIRATCRLISVVHLAGNIVGSTGRGESFPKYICSVI